MKILTFITMLLCFASCGCKSDTVEILNKPLYQDPAGWNIWTAQPGDMIVYYYYTRVVSQIGEDYLPDDFGQVFKDMDRNRSWRYYGLVITSTGGTSFWPEQSAVLMTYIDDGDTLETQSEELFIIRKCDLQPVYSRDRMLQLPSELEVFHTPKGHPVLFAKFPLTSQPDSILTVEPLNTLSH